MAPPRIRRLASELRMRRRRLDAYRGSDPWPGKGPALRFEQVRYDAMLLEAASMLDVTAPDGTPGEPLGGEARVVLEDRLALAGLDVLGPEPGTGDVVADGDLVI